MVLLLVFMQLTRDLFAIAKFLYVLLLLFFFHCYLIGELQLKIMVLDLRPRGHKLDFPPFRFHATTLGKLFTLTHVPLFTKQYNLVLAKGRWCSAGGKVAVGLASHWPCVTVSVVYQPTRSTAWEREMEYTAPLPRLHIHDLSLSGSRSRFQPPP